MQIQLETQPYASIAADALVTYIFDDDKLEGALGEINKSMDGGISSLISRGALTGKPLSMTLRHFAKRLGAKRLLLVGAGKQAKFSATADPRKIAGSALRYLKNLGAKKIAIVARDGHTGADTLKLVVEGLLIADFESDKYKTDKKEKKSIESVALLGFDANDQATKAIEDGRVVGESMNFARDLINEPSNRLTP